MAEMAICPNCGKIFEKKNGKRFCRKQCRCSFHRRECERKRPEILRERYLRNILKGEEMKQKKKHLNFIDSLPCCVCGNRHGITHHHLLRVAPEYLPLAEGEEAFLIPKVKSKGMGTKSDDMFCLPVCPKCHAAAHMAGNDKAFFQSKGIQEPERLALGLYDRTGDFEAAADLLKWVRLGVKNV